VTLREVLIFAIACLASATAILLSAIVCLIASCKTLDCSQSLEEFSHNLAVFLELSRATAVTLLVPRPWQAFIHYNPGKLQAEPFRQFFDFHGELLKLKPLH
jgi:hypothetical protein